MARRPGGQRRSLAALPGLDPRPAPRTARRRHAQDPPARLPRRAPVCAARRGSPCAAAIPRRPGTKLRAVELKPWIHRRLAEAAKLPPETDLSRIASFKAGKLVAAGPRLAGGGDRLRPRPGRTVVGRPRRGRRRAPCLPPGRAHGRKGVGRLHVRLGAPAPRGRAAAAARSPSTTSRRRSGKEPARPGKAASFDGVIVEAPSSGIGTWRRHPDARWTVTADADPPARGRTAPFAGGRKHPGQARGPLVYTVPTLTRTETTGVVEAFLRSHPGFQLQPFPHPLEDTTTGGTLSIWPHLHDCDGRFIARMSRSNSSRGHQGETGGADKGEAGT